VYRSLAIWESWVRVEKPLGAHRQRGGHLSRAISVKPLA